MYKLYKAIRNTNMYTKKDNNYITDIKHPPIIKKDTKVFLIENSELFASIKGLNYYVKKEDFIETNKSIQNNISILVYHFFYDASIGEQKSNHNFIEKEVFYNQMKYLSENKYNIIDSKQLADYLYNNKKIPKKTIMITIDDCAYSAYKYAFPILKKFKLKVIFFMITNTVKGNHNWHITEEMYKEMKKTGLIDFESHSYNCHQRLENGDGIMLEMSEKDIQKDLKKSVKFLKSNTIFSYPFGHYNSSIIDALKVNGFKLAVTTEFGKINQYENIYTLPRIRIEDMSLSDFIDIIDT